VKIDRGELILPNGTETARIPPAVQTTRRICVTRTRPSGILARGAGSAGYIFTAATDEHDEDGTLISDEFTNPQSGRMMVEKRARKMQG